MSDYFLYLNQADLEAFRLQSGSLKLEFVGCSFFRWNLANELRHLFTFYFRWGLGLALTAKAVAIIDRIDANMTDKGPAHGFSILETSFLSDLADNFVSVL